MQARWSAPALPALRGGGKAWACIQAARLLDCYCTAQVSYQHAGSLLYSHASVTHVSSVAPAFSQHLGPQSPAQPALRVSPLPTEPLSSAISTQHQLRWPTPLASLRPQRLLRQPRCASWRCSLLESLPCVCVSSSNRLEERASMAIQRHGSARIAATHVRACRAVETSRPRRLCPWTTLLRRASRRPRPSKAAAAWKRAPLLHAHRRQPTAMPQVATSLSAASPSE